MEYSGANQVQEIKTRTRRKAGKREMEDGTRLAIAILMMFLSMICFFFAFHPGGVQNVTNPDTALQWLMGEFDKTAGTNG